MDKLIRNLQTIACHTLLNQDQKRKFITAEVQRFLIQLEEDELPGIRANIRANREDTHGHS